MDDLRSLETPKPLESSEHMTEAMRTLDNATYQPEAHVERSTEIEQAEAIQGAFTAIVDSTILVGGEQISSVPRPSPRSPEDESTAGGSEGTGKASFGSDSYDPGQEYAGVDLESGEVLQDLDWNSESETGPSSERRDTAPASDGARIPVQEIDRRLSDQPLQRGEQDRTGDDEGGELGEVIGSPLDRIDDTSSNSNYGLDDDPFAQGGPLPSADGTGGGLFGDDIPQFGGFGEAIDAAIESLGTIPGETSSGGRIGGGPGAVHPRYGREQAGKEGEWFGIDIGGMIDQQEDLAARDESDMVFEGDVIYRSGTQESVHQAELDVAAAEADMADAHDRLDAGDADIVSELAPLDDLLWQARKWLIDQQVKRSDAWGSEVKMPRPDDGGGGGAPESKEDIDMSKAGGILVTDPAYTQGGLAGGWVLSTKYPGLVSDPGPDDHPPTAEGGIRAGREQVTDPPEEEGGG